MMNVCVSILDVTEDSGRNITPNIWENETLLINKNVPIRGILNCEA